MTITNGIKINQRIKQRVLDIADSILKTKSTVRQTADKFKVSKSTVHVDLTKRLEIINPELHKQVRVVLNYHLAIRHLRGGEATKIMFKKVKVD